MNRRGKLPEKGYEKKTKTKHKQTDLWLLVVRVRNLLPVVPVLWFFGFWILNLFGRQEVPVILQISRFNLLIVDLHLISVVRVDNQCVQVTVLIILHGRKEMLTTMNDVWLFYCALLTCEYCVSQPKTVLLSHLASDVLAYQMVLAFVVEDHMNFLCARATNIRT